MPGPKQKNVTIREDIWELARKKAESQDPPDSVAGYITKLIEKNCEEAPS